MEPKNNTQKLMNKKFYFNRMYLLSSFANYDYVAEIHSKIYQLTNIAADVVNKEINRWNSTKLLVGWTPDDEDEIDEIVKLKQF